MPSYFLDNLLLFVRLLRALGFIISPDQVSDLARILEKIGVARRADVYNAARALFVRKQSDLLLFDCAFNLFFSIQGRPPQSIIDPTQSPVARGLRPKTIQQLSDESKQRESRETAPPASESENLPLYSPAETFRKKRFDQFTADELRDARRLIEQMHWRVGLRQTRRYKRIARGAHLDLSRLLRRNLKHGADLYDLPERERKFKPRPLVILADISGSMERYSRLVLQLVHALGHAELAARVEVFVFGTRLTRITPDLKRRSVDAALARVSEHVPDWAGGTRIGDALKTFNYKWARRVLHNGAVVLIISDGWDCGDLELLREEMARLQRSCSRLIWLNPLLGEAAYQAQAQGLQIALPFVDDHLPINNLENLEQLVAVLATLDESRPLRRQNARVAIPRTETFNTRFMERPEMGTSDYVRRTLVLRVINGVPTFVYEENP
ncbi:MAG TPA: VWA domain-containing protein [Anaerolineae bacterium]|nr:VWA domain-containing protein [Anaerolineae bacterium]